MKKIDLLVKKWTLLSNLPKLLHSSKNITFSILLREGSIFKIFQKFFFEQFPKAIKFALCVPQYARFKIEGLDQHQIRAISQLLVAMNVDLVRFVRAQFMRYFKNFFLSYFLQLKGLLCVFSNQLACIWQAQDISYQGYFRALCNSYSIFAQPFNFQSSILWQTHRKLFSFRKQLKKKFLKYLIN